MKAEGRPSLHGFWVMDVRYLPQGLKDFAGSDEPLLGVVKNSRDVGIEIRASWRTMVLPVPRSRKIYICSAINDAKKSESSEHRGLSLRPKQRFLIVIRLYSFLVKWKRTFLPRIGSLKRAAPTRPSATPSSQAGFRIDGPEV